MQSRSIPKRHTLHPRRISHPTFRNLYVGIVCFLHFCGVDHKKLLPQTERPRPVDDTPEAYTQEDTTKFFFNVVNERDALAFEFFAQDRSARALNDRV